MILSNLIKTSEKFAIDNSPAILTAIGVTGTLSVAYLTGKASFKAAELINKENVDNTYTGKKIDLTKSDKFKMVWKEYVPAVGVGALTITSIIASNRIGARRAAAIAAVYTIAEKNFDEYREKIIEKLGDKKEIEARAEIAQDHVTKNPPTNVIVTGSGDVMCLDTLTGRYFKSNVEAIKKAQNDTNYQIIHEMYSSLSEFYSKIGLAPTPYSDEVGWTSDQLLEITFTTALTDDNQPCLCLDYAVMPVRHYSRMHE